MESKMKLLGVLVVVLACVGTASATHYATGGDWATAAGWAFNGSAPSINDDVYMYDGTVGNPQIVAASTTGYADFVRFDLGGAWTNDKKNELIVNGTLNVGNGASFDGLYFGTDAALAQYGSLITINAGGIVNTTQVIVQPNAGGAYDINLNGGTLIVTGGVTGLAGKDLNINLMNVDALLTVTSASLNSLISTGSLQAQGVVVTSASELSVTQNGNYVDVALVPEPATLALLGLGAIAAFRRKR
jgi:hypothetical protein